MELKEILVEYKKISLGLINAIKSDDEPEKFMEKREKLLNDIKQLTFQMEEFASLCEELNIVAIEKEISSELAKVKEEIRKELVDIKNKRDAARGYGAQMNNVNFLNTQI